MLLGSLLNDREDEFARDIYNLSQRPIFDVVAFEDFVDKIRSCVAEVRSTFCYCTKKFYLDFFQFCLVCGVGSMLYYL